MVPHSQINDKEAVIVGIDVNPTWMDTLVYTYIEKLTVNSQWGSQARYTCPNNYYKSLVSHEIVYVVPLHVSVSFVVHNQPNKSFHAHVCNGSSKLENWLV